MNKYKGFLAGLLLSAALCILLGAASNLTGNWNTTAPYQVNGADIIKSLTLTCDSLGISTGNVAVVTLPRAITVKSMSISANTKFTGINTNDSSKALLTFRSGAVTFVAKVDSGVQYQTTTPTAVDFAASAVCTLTVSDGGGDGTGGVKAQATIWYTDK